MTRHIRPQIYALKATGTSLQKIATIVERDVSTIEEKILEDWSPDQISGRLKDDDIASISHETIYQHIWEDKRTGGILYKHLRHNGKKYNKRFSSTAGRGCIPNRVDITERPQIAEQKARIGDWESDTVISAISKTALLTVVDRHSKFTRIKKIGRKTANLTIQKYLQSCYCKKKTE